MLDSQKEEAAVILERNHFVAYLQTTLAIDDEDDSKLEDDL